MRMHPRRTPGALLLMWSLAIASLLVLMSESARAWAEWPSNDAHILISDQYNNRVIEVDPATHKVVWSFGNGSDVAGPHSVVGVNDAERIGPFTLISGIHYVQLVGQRLHNASQGRAASTR